jgi:hypothetical protein
MSARGTDRPKALHSQHRRYLGRKPAVAALAVDLVRRQPTVIIASTTTAAILKEKTP